MSSFLPHHVTPATTQKGPPSASTPSRSAATFDAEAWAPVRERGAYSHLESRPPSPYSLVARSSPPPRTSHLVLVKEYLRQVLATGDVTRVLLLAKAHLLGFYMACGFQVLRVSPVAHGKDTWFEMGLGRSCREGCYACAWCLTGQSFTDEDARLVLAADRLSQARGRPFVQVDAFTGAAFKGNPAAVVFCEGGE